MTDTVSEFALPPTHLKVGMDVQDVLTGLKGRVQTINYRLSGTIQGQVQAAIPEGGDKLPDGYFIDHEALDVLGDGVSDRATAPGEPLVKLGWKVKDRTSGFVGIVDQIIVCFNGCIMLLLTGPVNKEGKVPHQYIDHKQVEKVDAGLSVDSAKPAPRAATGCRTEIAPRF